MRLSRRTARATAIAVAVTALLSTNVSAATRATVSTAGDSFSALVVMHTEDGMFAAPIHASVMPDGRVFLLGQGAPTFPTTPGDEGHTHFVMTPDPVGAALPTSVVEHELMAPLDAHDVVINGHLYDDTLVCGGNTFLSDGRLMISAGSRTVKDATTGKLQLSFGGTYATAFDGTNWTRLPGNFTGVGSFNTGRWYPTLTRLANGRILVTGGYDVLLPNFYANLSEEVYDPADGTYTTVSSQAQTPTQAHDADYTAVFQLPKPGASGDVLMIGEDGLPLYLNTATSPAGWQSSNAYRPGAAAGTQLSNGAGTAMLPIRLVDGQWGYHNGSVLTMSGHLGTSAVTRADVFDPVTNAWTRSIDTGTPRHYPAPVLLPDGRVLLINGHDTTPNSSVLSPQYIDPADGFSVSTSPANGVEVRGYHNVAVLLPDGRVMVSGGRDLDRATTSEKPDYAYFSPAYMTKPRPVITGAPTQLGYGQAALVGSSTVKVTDAVLMALPSMTHSFDQNQRSIQLKLKPVVNGTGAQLSAITGPADAATAPPGYYMLFLLDANRVPSVARMIHIG
ncbi:MAG: galactose oxidase-like domain-containing protein [Acidimicrobiales bacterium]